MDLWAVVPTGWDGRASWPEHSRLIEVAPRVGFARLARDFARMRSWSRRAKADVVVVPHEWAGPAGGARVVNVIQNILYLHPEGVAMHGFRAKVMRGIIRATHRFADTTVCVSRESVELWRGLTGADSIVIPQGISGVHQPGEGPRERRITVLTGSNAHKHPEIARDLVDAARRQFSDTEVHVVGLHLDSDSFSHQQLASEQLAALFRSSHAVVITSTIESFGLPAFEARACGALVVVHPRTAMAEWLADDPGTFVAGGVGAEALLETLCEVMALPVDAIGANTDHYWSAAGVTWADELVRERRSDVKGRR
ncbi:hypothetical protein GCM10007231_02320 [Nocardioides daphniae]|uniref:Glycosyltransferase n=1 Tax=Nocardioides daphniae TaxID=402297 RepID=A0ABQ1PZA0_9ACTN|nr:hypothetical protein GCM10007231_02320 [Nocardioides daphniae]